MNTPESREKCADQIIKASGRADQMTAFVGLDGFVDEILHVVDKRESAERYTRLPTIQQFSERLAAAAGRSTNVELVSQLIKLGGNGPIMANALASFGLKVTYLGILGYPNLHPVFADFSQRAEVYSIAEPGYTDALEFEDGKIMMGKHQSLKQMNWENIKNRFGLEKFASHFESADLVAFVNWTMLTAMSDIWSAIIKEICPGLKGRRRRLFFDLADPEKRTGADVLRALELIVLFQKYFDVTLGLNEKEGYEIGKHLGLKTDKRTPEGLRELCQAIHQRVAVHAIVIHPTAYAVASGPDGGVVEVQGPFTPKPKITTGAGDHFNSGFCLGTLLGFSTEFCLLTGVATSGFYVRSGRSPAMTDLGQLLRNWPSTNRP
jgi:sugar/nucleoside kinase (ribokinase family)